MSGFETIILNVVDFFLFSFFLDRIESPNFVTKIKSVSHLPCYGSSE